MAALIRVQAVAQRLVGNALQVDIQRGVNTQAPLVNRFGSVRRFEGLSNLLEKIRREVVARILDVQTERRLPGRSFFYRRDFPFFLHAMQREIAARERGLGIQERRKFRTIDHAGEQRCFRKLQIRDRLAEIKLRGSREPVIPMCKINLIRVHGENLRLGVAALDLQREQCFFRFPAKADVAAVQKKIPGKLHGDGAGAPGAPAFGQMAQGRREHAREVDAPVLFEVLVLDGCDGVVENFGTLLIGHQDAPLQREAADHLAVIGINLRHHRWAVRLQRANLGQVAGVNEKQSASRAKQSISLKLRNRSVIGGRLSIKASS